MVHFGFNEIHIILLLIIIDTTMYDTTLHDAWNMTFIIDTLFDNDSNDSQGFHFCRGATV